MTILVISCTKANNDIDIIDTPVKEYSVQEKTELISSYAQMLAASLHDPELRSKIKSEAQLKFDGDYDILISKFNNIKLSDKSMTVEHLLADTCIKTRSSEHGFDGSLEELIAEIQRTFPNLQVAVPVHCDDWDTDRYTPLVAYLPYDYIDQVTKEVEAFDLNGNTYTLSTKEEPDMPVIVVSISERVDENGKLRYKSNNFKEMVYDFMEMGTKSLVTPTNLTIHYAGSCGFDLSWEDVSNEIGYEIYRRTSQQDTYTKISQTGVNKNSFSDKNLTSGIRYFYKVRAITSSGYSAFSNIVYGYASERTDSNPLNVTKMRFTSRAALRNVEDWVSGAPEIKLRVYSGTSSSTLLGETDVFEPPTRDDILTLIDKGENDWWNKNVNAVSNWYIGAMGYVLNFDWREEDYNKKTTIEIFPQYYDPESETLKNSSPKITIEGDNGVDHIATMAVFFWDPLNKIHSAAGFEWMCN